LAQNSKKLAAPSKPQGTAVDYILRADPGQGFDPEPPRPKGARQIGGEFHEQVGEPLRTLWGKVWSRLPQPLGPAILPKGLQGRFPCENSEGPCAHEKVVWTGRFSIAEGSCWKYGESVMHLDIILLVVLTALAVWTEVDKLRRRKMPQEKAAFRSVRGEIVRTIGNQQGIQ